MDQNLTIREIDTVELPLALHILYKLEMRISTSHP
jgi:hypothetical protein